MFITLAQTKQKFGEKKVKDDTQCSPAAHKKKR